MYAQVGDFGISRGPPTVPLMQILRNMVFSSPKIRVRWGPSAHGDYVTSELMQNLEIFKMFSPDKISSNWIPVYHFFEVEKKLKDPV